MISLTSTSCGGFSFTLPLLRPSCGGFSSSISALKVSNKNLSKRRIKIGKCRAVLVQDAPLAATIGACMLSSLILPAVPAPDEEGDAVMSLTDSRFAVMGILTFVPYFNWLSWVFACLDTGKRRYAVYAIVYMAPYISSNMSLSPEESWLPLASIIFCIVHVQLEASIRNGDIQTFKFFSAALKGSPSLNRKNGHREGLNEEEGEEQGHNKNLPSSESDPRIEIEWDVPQKPLEGLTEDWDDDHRRKH